MLKTLSCLNIRSKLSLPLFKKMYAAPKHTSQPSFKCLLPIILSVLFSSILVPVKSFGANPTTFTLGNPATSVTTASKCAGSTRVPIHAFTITADGTSGTGTLTNFKFTTTGNYLASELVNFKIWYNTTNSLATAALVATNSSPSAAGTQTFPAFARSIAGGATVYFWITMVVASTVTDGHTITVASSVSTDMTTTLSKAGSAAASGTQTL